VREELSLQSGVDFWRHPPHSWHAVADESFKEFVMDQLDALPELRAQAMFGGHGFYQADKFFGILMDGRLYFKTDEQSRVAYAERGMEPFIYEKARRTMTMNYFEVPPDVLENRDEFVIWARRAVQAAGTRRKKPAARSR
jgi:DNA transformation protein